MSVTTDRTQTEGGETFDSLAPATGDVVATLPVHGEAEVREAVQRARRASQWWSTLSFDERGRRLRAYAGVLARRRDELLDLISRENGKPRVDALIEHTLVLEHLGWAAKNARRVMKPRKVSGSLLLSNIKPILEYQPLGVVGIIGPWNYPLFTPMGSIAYALAAGNAVVFKPREYTPAVGVWLPPRRRGGARGGVQRGRSRSAGVPGRDRVRRHRRCAVSCGCRQARVHRLGSDRPQDHGRVRGDTDAGPARARRQRRDARRQRRRHPHRCTRGVVGRMLER